MPRIPVIMPQLGESIAEAIVVRAAVAVGDTVSVDQDVFEVETNKAVMSVTTPCAGVVAEIPIDIGESYTVGTTLAWLEVTAEEAANRGLDIPAGPLAIHPATEQEKEDEQEERPHQMHTPLPSNASSGATKPAKLSHAGRAKVEPTVRSLPVPAHAAGATYLSPRMKARMAELGLHAVDLSGVAGSGAGGRVTIEDLENFIGKIEEHKLTPASSMRVAVADAMRRSWTRPLATVGLSFRLDALLAHRKTTDPKAGPALYACRALALALAENTVAAGRLVGGRIVHPKAVDIGFAVEAEDGVLVPVLRDADKKPLSELVVRYNQLVELARQRRLPPDATGGSIATVTNFGTFGLEWATPIPLPEQTVLLGLGAGQVVPKWNPATKTFEPATEAQLTLSFDHRVLDGGAAGRLLQRVVALLNDPSSL